MLERWFIERARRQATSRPRARSHERCFCSLVLLPHRWPIRFVGLPLETESTSTGPAPATRRRPSAGSITRQEALHIGSTLHHPPSPCRRLRLRHWTQLGDESPSSVWLLRLLLLSFVLFVCIISNRGSRRGYINCKFVGAGTNN